MCLCILDMIKLKVIKDSFSQMKLFTSQFSLVHYKSNLVLLMEIMRTQLKSGLSLKFKSIIGLIKNFNKY